MKDEFEKLEKKKVLISPPARAPWAEVLTRPGLKIKSSHNSLGLHDYTQLPLFHLLSKYVK